MPYRYVVIVPRSAPETLAYLAKSFKDVPDVEVMVDRRAARPTTPPPDVERRAPGRWAREAFGCALVRLEVPAVENGAVHFRAVPELRGA